MVSGFVSRQGTLKSGFQLVSFLDQPGVGTPPYGVIVFVLLLACLSVHLWLVLFAKANIDQVGVMPDKR